MTLAQAITRISYALRGLDDDAPVSGSDEYAYWLDTLNRKKDELYQDVTKRWSITYEVRSLGTITANAAPSFELDDDFLAASDSAYIITTDDQRVDVFFSKPEERDTRIRQVFIAGGDPEVLYFTSPIVAGDSIIGGTLYLPAYWMPADLAAAGDTLPFPDPNWGVMATAAEIAFNDIIYEDKASDLNEKANALMRTMAQKNRRGTYGNSRITPTSVKRIRDTRSVG